MESLVCKISRMISEPAKACFSSSIAFDMRTRLYLFCYVVEMTGEPWYQSTSSGVMFVLFPVESLTGYTRKEHHIYFQTRVSCTDSWSGEGRPDRSLLQEVKVECVRERVTEDHMYWWVADGVDCAHDIVHVCTCAHYLHVYFKYCMFLPIYALMEHWCAFLICVGEVGERASVHLPFA